MMMNNSILGCENMVSVCFLYQRRDIHLLSKIQLIMVLPCYHVGQRCIYICIAPYHPHHHLCILCALLRAHAYRIARGNNAFGVRGSGRGGLARGLAAIAPEIEEQVLEDLPKCPDHKPSSYLKGKPQSILSLLCFTNINLSPLCLIHQVIGVDWKHLMHIISLYRNIP